MMPRGYRVVMLVSKHANLLTGTQRAPDEDKSQRSTPHSKPRHSCDVEVNARRAEGSQISATRSNTPLLLLLLLLLRLILQYFDTANILLSLYYYSKILSSSYVPYCTTARLHSQLGSSHPAAWPPTRQRS